MCARGEGSLASFQARPRPPPTWALRALPTAAPSPPRPLTAPSSGTLFSWGACPMPTARTRPAAHSRLGTGLCRRVGAGSGCPELCAGPPHAGTWNGARELEAPLSHGFQNLAPWPPGPWLRQGWEPFRGPAAPAHAALGHCKRTAFAPPEGGAERGVISSPKGPCAPLQATSERSRDGGLCFIVLHSGLEGRALPGEKPE